MAKFISMGRKTPPWGTTRNTLPPSFKTYFLGELACRVGEDGVHKPKKIAFESREAVN